MMKIIKSSTSATPNKDKIYNCLVEGYVSSADVLWELYKYISDDDAGEILRALDLDEYDV